MSGRIRTIKPELLDDAVTAGLSDMAFRLFVSSIVLADDYGRLRARVLQDGLRKSAHGRVEHHIQQRPAQLLGQPVVC